LTQVNSWATHSSRLMLSQAAEGFFKHPGEALA